MGRRYLTLTKDMRRKELHHFARHELQNDQIPSPPRHWTSLPVVAAEVTLSLTLHMVLA